MLSATDLAAMRATAEEAFPDALTVRRFTYDPELGRVEGDTQASTGRLTPWRREKMGDFTFMEFWRLDYPYDLVIGDADQVEVGSRVYYLHEVISDRSWELTGKALVGQLKRVHSINVDVAFERLDAGGVVLPVGSNTAQIDVWCESGGAKAAQMFGDMVVYDSAPVLLYAVIDDEPYFSAAGTKFSYEGANYYVVATRRIPVSGCGPYCVVLADRMVA